MRKRRDSGGEVRRCQNHPITAVVAEWWIDGVAVSRDPHTSTFLRSLS